MEPGAPSSAAPMMSKAAREAVTPLADARGTERRPDAGVQKTGASMMTAKPWKRESIAEHEALPTSTATRATDRVVRDSRTPPERESDAQGWHGCLCVRVAGVRR